MNNEFLKDNKEVFISILNVVSQHIPYFVNRNMELTKEVLDDIINISIDLTNRTIKEIGNKE